MAVPVLERTGIIGRVEATLLVADREISLQSIRRDSVELTYAGIPDDAHSGLTRASCIRVISQYERGTEIRNTRQLSILSEEELAEIAAAMDIPHLAPEWVGGNLVISGIADLTQIPPSSRLIFSSGAAVTVDMENGPCRFPGDVIEGHHTGKGRKFAKCARGKRGLTGWVEREGPIAPGDIVTLHIPLQRIYGASAAGRQHAAE